MLDTPPPVPPSGTPPAPNLVDLVNVLADRIDPIIKVISTTMEHRQKVQDSEIRFQTHMSLTAISLVTLIVGIAAFLTYHGKIEGSAFTFLLGLIVGYVLTFVRDQIQGGD